MERLVNLHHLDSGLRAGLLVSLALACLHPLAGAIRVRIRRKGPRPPARPRLLACRVTGSPLVAPSRLLPLLGFAFAAAPSHARAQHSGPPVGAEPWATPPWIRTSGDPPHPPRPLVRSWAPRDASPSGAGDLREGRPHTPGSFVHPAIHGRTFAPHGRLVPLFPRAAQGRVHPPNATGAHAAESTSPAHPDADARLSAMAESIRRHPSGKATSTGSPSSRLSSAHRCARGHVRGSYTVRRGDTLWSIAEQLLGTDDPGSVARYWPKIHRANRDVIGPDPSLIYPGQVLHLPPCEE